MRMSSIPWWAIALSLLSALLLILSFPEFDLEFFAWVALVPLLLAIRDKSLKSAFTLSFLTGTAFFLVIFYWVTAVENFKWIDIILLGFYLGGFFGLFGLINNLLFSLSKKNSCLIAASLWVSIEYLRSHAGFLGLPWALLGHSQYLNLPLIQITSFTGVYGVSFLIVLVNAALANMISDRSIKFREVSVISLLIGLSFIYGFTILHERSESGKVSVTVIQPNIPPATKWLPELRDINHEKHVRLTREAADSGNTSIIVWPEASAQGSLRQDVSLLQSLSNLAKETNTYLLVGSSERPKFGSGKFRKSNWVNSAVLFSSKGGIEGVYNKIYLVPFGEYLPYKNVLPWPARLNIENFIPGTRHTIFNVNGAKFGVTICWESIFPELFREYVKSGAVFMINITNEGRLGKTSAPYHIAAINVFRAVENGVSIARSANTGISCFIDPHGRMIGKVENNKEDIFVDGFLTKEIPTLSGKTFYTTYGDVFAYGNIIIISIMLCFSFTRLYERHRQN